MSYDQARLFDKKTMRLDLYQAESERIANEHRTTWRYKFARVTAVEFGDWIAQPDCARLYKHLNTYQFIHGYKVSTSYRQGLPVSRAHGCDQSLPSLASGFRQSLPERRIEHPK